MSRSRNTQAAWVYSRTMRRLSDRWHLSRYVRKHGLDALRELQHEADTLRYLPRGTRKKSEWDKAGEKNSRRKLRYSAKKQILTTTEET